MAATEESDGSCQSRQKLTLLSSNQTWTGCETFGSLETDAPAFSHYYSNPSVGSYA